MTLREEINLIAVGAGNANGFFYASDYNEFRVV